LHPVAAAQSPTADNITHVLIRLLIEDSSRRAGRWRRAHALPRHSKLWQNPSRLSTGKAA
jgi:hypothetical protein